MLDWQSPEDGVIITAEMTNEQVWLRCNLTGASRLATALEMFLDEIGQDGTPVQDRPSDIP